MAVASDASAKSEALVEEQINKFFRGRYYWEPYCSPDWDGAGPPSILASRRIKSDISNLCRDPLPGIFIVPDESNFNIIHCLILGPFDTPYEGGFFYFVVRCGPSYPIHPPRVKFMTTNGGKLRFNPNFYANGTVCLSILKTWSGPSWSPAQSLGSLLLSIQSLLTENPYYNEPGFTSERIPGASEAYNSFLRHETLRISVCNQLQNILLHKECSMPSALQELIQDLFLDLYDSYVKICDKYIAFDNQPIKAVQPRDMFRNKNCKNDFQEIKKNLSILKDKLKAKPSVNGHSESSSSDDSSLSSTSETENTNVEEEEEEANSSDINKFLDENPETKTELSESEN